MIRLLVKSEGESREVELADAVVTLGRSAENLVVLADRKASRKHAKIEKTDSGYVLTDLESGNGTRVNGKDVKTYVLAKGDEIQIGLTSLFVLDLDSPAPAVPAAAAPAPVPAAAPAPAPAAPAPAKPAVPEFKRRITRRAFSARSAAPGRAVAVAAIFIILGAVAYAFVFHHHEILPKSIGPAPRPAAASKAEPSRAEAEKALEELRVRAAAGPVTDALVREAEEQAERFEAVAPGFAALRDDLKRRRSEDIAKMTFAEVERLVQEHLQNQRYGEAIHALKALAGTPEAGAASSLLERITAQVRADRETVDEAGKKLVEAKRYSEAAEHYRKNAPRFRGTEHYSYLAGKPERLMLLSEAELAAAKAKAERPAAPPAPPAPPKPAEEPLAKAMPAPEPPKPAMKPEPMKPEPAMKPEAPKPEPMKPEPMKPPAPKPEPPKPEPAKPEPAKAEKARPAFKKPPVLCDIKRTVKGMFCTTCDRVLDPENDTRRGVCKRCDGKPMKIDMCVRRYFQAACHPEKVSDKPVFC